LQRTCHRALDDDIRADFVATAETAASLSRCRLSVF
jgi:hypothetical protein